MGYKTLIISVLILLLTSNESFSELKNDFWISIETSGLQYTQVNGGLLLRNNCDYEITEIQVQTYPSASNGVTRFLGLGSYYLKVGSLKQGASVKANWNKFSDTEGQRLKLEEYSFNRISISGRKDSEKKELIDEHLTCDPNISVENRGFNIRIKNICDHPIRVAVHYKNTQGSWVTNSWWAFKPYESGNLSNNGQFLLTGDSMVYYYAETTDSSNIVWEGDKSFNYIGLKKYGMREYEDLDGVTDIELNCNNSQLPVHGDRYTNSLGMEFVYIEAGTFMMGSPPLEDGRDDYETQHRVTLTKGYWMQTKEVTVAQFRKFVAATGYKTDAEKNAGGKEGSYVLAKGKDGKWTWGYRAGYSWRNPGFDQTDDMPVCCVSWNDAKAFIAWLNEQTGKTYGLPSEAQWEYAARGGSSTARFWGEDPEDACAYANVGDLSRNGTFRWNRSNSHNCKDGYFWTSPVGSFQRNGFGLCDMIGNLLEWCQDWYGEYPNAAVTDPTGSSTGKLRVVRGGSWSNSAGLCRSAFRGGSTPDDRDSNDGFRLAAPSGR